MRLSNYQMSEEKWRIIVEELSKPGRVDWGQVLELLHSKCGHCVEHDQECDSCSLYRINYEPGMTFCSSDWGDTDLFHYLQWITQGKIPRNKCKALSIAKSIYAAILKDDPRVDKRLHAHPPRIRYAVSGHIDNDSVLLPVEMGVWRVE